jgi:putative CocE/NonD family hydrolase
MDAWDEQAGHLPLREQRLLKDTGVSDYYFDWLSHPDDDEYWQRHDSVPHEKITVPAFILASWYDFWLSATLASYRSTRENGGSAKARDNVKLIIGPWVHGAQFSQHAGDIDFGIRAAGSSIDMVGMDLRWFDYWLKGQDTGLMDEPPVRIFVMGDNVWRHENEWPLARTEYIKYYIHSGGRANSLNGDGALSIEPRRRRTLDRASRGRRIRYLSLRSQEPRSLHRGQEF